MNKIKFPSMRVDLLAFTSELADEVYQRTNWLDSSSSRSWDNFDEVIHFFYDDTSLSKNPAECIGAIIFDQDEANAVKNLIISLDSLFKRYGLKESDAFYIESELWKDVVSAAQSLLSLMLKNDKASH